LKRRTFLEFLRRSIRAKALHGAELDFATDYCSDPFHPHSGKRETILRYLQDYQACEDALQAFDRLFAQWFDQNGVR
jgi:hypothetical protein